MPRIIENVKERAIIEARKVLEKEGYQALTVRGIADALAIGLGTVYNYFPSKDHLVACVILEDWMSLIREFEAQFKEEDTLITLESLFNLVKTFTDHHRSSFFQYRRKGLDGKEDQFTAQYHHVLIRQLSGYIIRTISGEQQEREPYLAEFLAELVLRFGSDGFSTFEIIRLPAGKLLYGNAV